MILLDSEALGFLFDVAKETSWGSTDERGCSGTPRRIIFWSTSCQTAFSL